MSQDNPFESFQNATIARMDEVIERHGDAPWSEKIIQTELVMGTFIYQNPGSSNRRHYHSVEHEFWVILKGEVEWDFDDEKVLARAGDIVFAKANRRHQITTVGVEPSVRFAIVKTDVLHIWDEKAKPAE